MGMIAILAGKGKKPPAADKEKDPLDELMKEEPEKEGEELPSGLVAAISKMRSAESDEDAARAFMSAMKSCREGM